MTHDQNTRAARNAQDAEAEIRALMDERVRAVRAKDVEAVLAHIAPDTLAFDLLVPLQYKGRELVRQRLAEWFASFEGPLDFELRELHIAAGEDVAFCHSLNGVRGTTTTGDRIDMWFRATVGWRRIEGSWLVTHEHSSSPIEMPSGKARFDLQP